jgi:hypothetical protein
MCLFLYILSQFVKPPSDTLLRYFNMFHPRFFTTGATPSPSSVQLSETLTCSSNSLGLVSWPPNNPQIQIRCSRGVFVGSTQVNPASSFCFKPCESFNSRIFTEYIQMKFKKRRFILVTFHKTEH